MMHAKTLSVLNHLRKTGSVSAREAMIDLNIGSITKEISRLRADGFNIKTVQRINPASSQSYARYYLHEK